MTFSQQVKQELCRLEIRRECCGLAELYGMLLFSRSFAAEGQIFATENKQIAEYFAQLAAGLAGMVVTIRTDFHKKAGDAGRYSVVVEDACERDLLFRKFGLGMPSLNPLLLENNCCPAAFFRGIFLLYGSVTNPEREYHLELAAPSAYMAEEVYLLGQNVGMQWKISRRKGNFILYMKESEQIEDFLTYIGATKATLQLMDIKIVKDMRNKVNRTTNCETANLDKTVGASREQVADIAYIQSQCGLSYLDEDLRKLAELRLENPECSLRELAEMLDPPLSRSGVNHRLKRIQQVAADLRANHQGKEDKK
ncbi:MAG: DNA-binding protein WhiA [Candidatus Merdivicinus sp.]|jgi:DNA-binding protein WhiA